jgi:DNA repair protein RadA/Sms
MTKFKTVYICQQCGVETPKWSGQCPNCQAWNSLVEEVVEKTSRSTKSTRGTGSTGGMRAKVVSLAEVEAGSKGESERKTTGSSEFDRVLGGGIVPGSVVLVAGEPGIGKSTLLTQLAMKVGRGKFEARSTKFETIFKFKRNK